MPRDNIVLQCSACKSRNYVTTKNKKTTPDRLSNYERGTRNDEREFNVHRSAIIVAHRGIVSTVSTSVSKTESPGSNPGTPASELFRRG